MTTPNSRLAVAAAAAALQRQRLRLRVNATKQRLLPARLKADATDAAEHYVAKGAALGVDQVKRHPLMSGAAVGALLAWTFREPLLRHGPAALRRAYAWFDHSTLDIADTREEESRVDDTYSPGSDWEDDDNDLEEPRNG